MANQPVPEATKICAVCGLEKPATAEYFHRDSRLSDELRRTCRECTSVAKKNADPSEEAVELNKKLAEKALEYANQLSSGITCDPGSLAQISDSLQMVFGGPSGIASRVMAHFLSLPEGSPGRLKVLEMIPRFAEKAEAAGGKKDPSELTTDEEIKSKVNKMFEAQIEERANELAEEKTRRAVNEVTRQQRIKEAEEQEAAASGGDAMAPDLRLHTG